MRDEMVAAYPELMESAERIAKVVLAEELQFARTLEIGLGHLEQLIATKVQLRDAPIVGGMQDLTPAEYSLKMYERTSLLGPETFKLYETFGMPLDFMVDAARDAEINIDLAGFDEAKAEEQQRARASWKGGSQKSAAPVYRELAKTEFAGYTALRVDGARVLALVKDGVGVAALSAGETGRLCWMRRASMRTPVGRWAMVGWLYAGDHNTVVAEVTGCKKPVQGCLRTAWW